MIPPKKFFIKTFGCKVNQYETQLLREKLIKAGLTETDKRSADIIIINSCTVTAQADYKTKKMLRAVIKESPGKSVYLTGCLAVKKEDIESVNMISGVKVVENKDKMGINSYFPIKNKTNIFHGIKGITGLYSHSRAFVKIQDGCNQSCAYCKVRLVRGPSYSREMKDILVEIKAILDKGYQEIVLTGICLGDWQWGGYKLVHLLEKINEIDGKFRVRLSSIEPNFLTKETINAIVSTDKICHHLHIPLQSGSEKILKLMKRRYNPLSFLGIVEEIRKKDRFFGITTDIIAGFPGEGEKDHAMTLEFIRQVRPSRLHVFGYSPRKGTPAYSMPYIIQKDVINERVAEIMLLGSRLEYQFAEKFIEKPVEILAEKADKNGFYAGYTREYVRVRTEISSIKKGTLCQVKPNKIHPQYPVLISDNN